MDKWRATFLGLKRLPRELTAFEIQAFLVFTAEEKQLIEDRRRGPELKLDLALQIGFLANEWPSPGGSAHRTDGAMAPSR